MAVAFWVVGGFALAAEAVYPVEKSASWFRRNVTSRVRTLWRRQSYGSENARLRRENDILRMALQEAESQLSTANAGAEPGTALRGWIQAPVLSRGGAAGAANFLRIGKGSADGVVAGAAVAVPDGLVGIVSKVSHHTCTIQLITDPEVKVSCRLETGEPSLGEVFGIVYGNGAKTVAQTDVSVLYVVNPLRAGHIKNGYDPPPRTRVVTSGLGGVYPKGIVIGYLISGTHEDETKLEREGEVAPAVDFPALEEVFIRNEG